MARGILSFLAVGLLLLFAQPHTTAQGSDALAISGEYLITGNYVVGGVDLVSSTSKNGFATGTIRISGVPDNPDIVAAYLYWETISSNIAQHKGVKFRGSDVGVAVANTRPLVDPSASCRVGGSANTSFSITTFRADVLHLLPARVDISGKTVGKRLVNDADLLAAHLPSNTVTLPEKGSANQVPQSAGASLFVVYRDPTLPLTKIVAYDGLFMPSGPGGVMTQTLRGFWKSASRKPGTSRFTPIVSSGAPNGTDQLLF